MNQKATKITAPAGLIEVLRERWHEADVDSLRDALYVRAFTRALTARPPTTSHVLPNTDLTRLLSASNQGRDRWIHGWRIERVGESGTIVARSGERQRTARPGEYALTFSEHLPPRIGMAASLYFARESLTLQTGVYYAFGMALPENEDEDRPLRIYLQAPETVLPDLYQHLTGQLNQAELPFTLKSMLKVADRDRSDATVLYVPRRHREQLEDTLAQLPKSLLKQLGPRVPLFTLKMAPGIGMAESPGNGESFGMHRCRLVAEGILEARQTGCEDWETRLLAVERRFRAQGIDLARPHMGGDQKKGLSIQTPGKVLHKDNIIEWLRDLTLLTEGDSQSSWRVKSHASRNQNFSAQREDGTGYFVKQLRVQGAESLRMMEREAQVYNLLKNMDDHLRDIAPVFYLFEPDAQALVIELLPHARPVAELQLPDFPVAVAEAAGRTLGLLHKQPIDRQSYRPYADHFDLQPPGIYTAHRGGPLLQWLGSGQLLLIDCVREQNGLTSELDLMASNWRCNRLIHGDVKWENCMWTELPSGAGDLKWVDWELADLGDPNWDAGCFVQAYLSKWVQMLPPHTRWNLADMLQHSTVLRSAMEPVVRAFLREYLAALAVHESEVPTIIEQIMRCAAARMIQMSLEVMHGQPEPTDLALDLLEMSVEIMAQPREMLSRFLGSGVEWDRSGS